MILPERNRSRDHVAGYLIQALHLLAEALGPYAAEQAPDGSLSRNPSAAAVLGIMDDDENWERNFRGLGSEPRGWVREIRRMNDLHAHQRGYSDHDVHRALDTIQRLLAAISADRHSAEVGLMYLSVGALLYGRSDESLQDASIFLEWGEHHYRLGAYDATIADCTAAIKVDPEHAQSYTLRGNARVRKDETDLAIEDFSEVINLNPHSSSAYGNRGATYARKGEQDLAIADFNKAIELDRDNGLAYGSRGAAYYQKGEYDRAIEDLEKAIEIYPEWAALYNDRGRAYREYACVLAKQDFVKAIELIHLAIGDFDKAIELIPEWGGAYGNRGRCHHDNDELDRALQDYDTAIGFASNWNAASNDIGGNAWRPVDIDDTVAATYYRRGVVHFRGGDCDLAIADFSEALRLTPPNAPAYLHIGGLRTPRRISAISAARLMRGRAYAEMGEYDSAIADYTEAIQRQPDWGEPYNRRARLRENQSKDDYSEVIRLDPENTDALFRRARIHENQGKDDKAEADYETVLRLDPRHTGARRNLDRLRVEI